MRLPCLNIIIAGSCAAERRGIVTSLYGSVRFFGVAIGPPAFGIMLAKGRPLMFWSAAGLAALAALLALLLIRVKDMAKASEPENQSPKLTDNKQGRDAQSAPRLQPAQKPLPDSRK